MTATAVKELPILFSAPMVRAILDGRKTQTRRIVKMQPLIPGNGPDYPYQYLRNARIAAAQEKCPYGQPGDRLWVREAWAEIDDEYGGPCMVYRADKQACHIGLSEDRGYHLLGDWHTFDAPDGETWKPSIHMPRWASRLTLELTGVRVERLKDISEADAKCEGVPQSLMASTHRIGFFNLWNSIHGCNADDANPWVWVLSFRRLEGR